MSTDESLREHLAHLLRGGGAHLDFEKAVAGIPSELRGVKPPGIPHTAWRLVEHLRIAQWDILQFSRNPSHVSPAFPEGYWPTADGPEDDEQWNHTLERFRSDLKAMIDLVLDPSIDLLAPISHGDGQTLLREALLVADHHAYHLGQLVLLRRLLGAWSDD